MARSFHTLPNVEKIFDHLRACYSLDYRSLAAFRVLLCLALLRDLAQRYGNATVHYSDAGILPRTSAIPILAADRWSVLLLNGSPGFVRLVIVIGMIAAAMMLVGLRTRLATVVLWMVVVSLQARNNHLTYGADTLIRLSLFWSMFLPLGAVWSLDRRHSPKPASTTIANLATFALMAQIAAVYLFTALLKDGSRWRTDYDAVYYALGMRDLSTGLGNWLFLNGPANLFTAFTMGTLWMEFAVPIMLLMPVRAAWLRGVAIALVLALHIGIGTTMSVGLFPAISIATIVVILPSSFWSLAFVRKVAWFAPLQAIIATRNPETEPVRSIRAQSPVMAINGQMSRFLSPPISVSGLSLQHIANLCIALAIALGLLWNVTTVSSFELPEPLRRTAVAAGLYQHWGMFAPNPRMATVWFVIEGELASGEKIDLLPFVINGDLTRGHPVVWNQSNDVQLNDERWRKYFHAIRTREDDRLKLAGYVCRTWNAENSGEKRLETVTITVGSAATLPNRERAEPAFEPMGFWNCS